MSNQLKLSVLLILILCQCSIIKGDFVTKHIINHNEKTPTDNAITKDGKLVAVGLSDGSTHVYDGTSEVYHKPNEAGAQTGVALTKDFLAVGKAGAPVKVYSVGPWEKVHETTDSYYLYNNVNNIAIPQSGKWLVCGSGFYLDFISTDPWQLKRTLSQSDFKPTTALRFSQDDTYLARASEASVRILKENDQWEEVKAIEIQGTENTDVSFSNNELAVNIGNGTVQIYKVGEFTFKQSFETKAGKGIKCEYSKDSKYLAVATDSGSVEFYDSSYNLVQTMMEELGTISDISFSEDIFVADYKLNNKGYTATFKWADSAASKLFLSVVSVAFLLFGLI